jgi:two-component system, LytTR family, response regulator
MVNASLIESSGGALDCLEIWISKLFPEISISYKANSLAAAWKTLPDSDSMLVFIDIAGIKNEEMNLVDKIISAEFEVIFVTTIGANAADAIKYGATGYILKPIKKNDFVLTVRNALRRIKKKEEQQKNNNLLEMLTSRVDKDQIIGIPTLEGYEFIQVSDIIRCEGLQKCTRIITNEKTDIISSYNLGEFRKLLEPFGFYSPHKSHLINLKHIRKYHREGSIIMLNGSYVPVSKRKKKDFLEQFTHL